MKQMYSDMLRDMLFAMYQRRFKTIIFLTCAVGSRQEALLRDAYSVKISLLNVAESAFSHQLARQVGRHLKIFSLRRLILASKSANTRRSFPRSGWSVWNPSVPRWSPRPFELFRAGVSREGLGSEAKREP